MSNKRHLLAAVAALALITPAGTVLAQTTSAPVTTAHAGHAAIGAWGFDPASRDLSVKPGDDFNRYASGAWLDKAEIPADRTSWSNWDVLYDQTQDYLKAIIENAGAHPDSSPEASKIGGLFNSFMDEARVNRLGAQPLAADLAAVRAADTREKMAVLMGHSFGGFGSSLFSAYVAEDLKNPDAYAVYLSHDGLGLPEREYYLSDQFAEAKTAYQAYVAKMLTLAGWSNPDQAAADILAFETKVAEAHWAIADRRDMVKTYNPTTLAQLATDAPGFPWQAWAQAGGFAGQPQLIVSENTAFPKLAQIFADTPLATLQAWQAFHIADQAAPYLSQAFVDARFDFRGKVLNGTPENRPRWKRGVTLVDGTLGEALGKEYVAQHFPPSSKAQMETLVQNLIAAMRIRLQNLDWMSEETKQQALYKIDHFNVKIGYPEKWRDYSGLQIRADDLYGNVERAAAFEWAYNLDKLKGPVDPLEWGMTPQTINAYYNPPRNEIVFPAAILQPPFFDPNADPAVNYGGIGAVIGHEISHGFDDQGRTVDGDGVLRDWWTAEDATKFEQRTAVLGAQFDAAEPLPGVHINGRLTMGENIGDLGGLLVALDAYHLSLDGKPAPVLDGLTGDQRFFLGWAQVWREKIRDAALQQQLATDPHSPGEARAALNLRNVDAWYSAFDVKPGDKGYVAPEDRARIW
ncbi:M13-type metalloendopeptidase [Brevundimonas sp.]|uniref:M13 family metallopeptidase n=1 Tax=Brevundimonas sp. TaxID=1871086 RepID=UPI0019938CED|nr:M13-type metalloendopeptidase [Brevundimonas sp.]MBD3835579.1 peptidase M13 [Brevundimonas sp.]